MTTSSAGARCGHFCSHAHRTPIGCEQRAARREGVALGRIVQLELLCRGAGLTARDRKALEIERVLNAGLQGRERDDPG
jgi:hypothetical protein